jgi:hypothetical protein
MPCCEKMFTNFISVSHAAHDNRRGPQRQEHRQSPATSPKTCVSLVTTDAKARRHSVALTHDQKVLHGANEDIAHGSKTAGRRNVRREERHKLRKGMIRTMKKTTPTGLAALRGSNDDDELLRSRPVTLISSLREPLLRILVPAPRLSSREGSK